MLDPSASAPPPSSFRPSPGPGKGPVLAVVAGVLVLCGGGAAYWYLSRPAPKVVAAPKPSPEDAGSAAEADAGEDGGVPAVDQSDGFARDQLKAISADPTVQHWLQMPGLVRRLVASVAAMADGESPGGTLGVLAPPGKFDTMEHEGGTFISAKSYARYDGLTQAADTIDVKALAAAIETLKPLCDRVWKEIGPPRTTFAGSVDAALRRIAEAPVLTEELALVPRGGIWAFKDPALEAKTPLEKHLLRMGPANTKKLSAKAEALRTTLRGSIDADAGEDEALLPSDDASEDAGASADVPEITDAGKEKHAAPNDKATADAGETEDTE